MISKGYNYICSGYLVEDKRVLLVLHNIFKKWVPPGGHVEDGEMFSETAEREFAEETGIKVRAISSAPVLHQPDENASPLPLPFYTDVLREGLKIPTIAQYYYVEPMGEYRLKFDPNELDDAQWFGIEELEKIETFEQVRSLSRYVLKYHPNC